MIDGEGLEGPAEKLLSLTRQIADHSQATAASIDDDAGFPTEDVELLRASGLLAAPLSMSAGGLGLGMAPGRTNLLLDVLAELGRGNLALGRLYEGHVNALQLVQAFGTPEQVEYAAMAAAAEGRLFGVWNSEDASPGSGVSMTGRRRRCPARREDVRFRVPGTSRALWSPLPEPTGGDRCAWCRWMTCQLTVSMDFWHPLGMRASASHRVGFDGALIEPDLMIGQPDDYIREPLFRGGAIRFAAVQVGGAQALLDAARQYIRLAGRAAEPLIQERPALAALAIEGCRLWLRAAADSYDAYLREPAATPTARPPRPRGVARQLREPDPRRRSNERVSRSWSWSSGRSAREVCFDRIRSNAWCGTCACTCASRRRIRRCSPSEPRSWKAPRPSDRLWGRTSPC